MFQKIVKHLLAGELVLVLLICAGLLYKKEMINSVGKEAMAGYIAVSQAGENQEQTTSEQITLDYEQTSVKTQWNSQDEAFESGVEDLEEAMGLIEDSEESEEENKKECQEEESNKEQKDFIKWLDFNVTCEAMNDAYEYDMESQSSKIKLNWIELLAYLGTKYGGDFSRYKCKDMQALVDQLVNQQIPMEELVKNMQCYSYFREAYEAVLGGFVGTYAVEVDASNEQEQESNEPRVEQEQQSIQPENILMGQINAEEETEPKQETVWETRYGLKAYLPLAKNFPYNDYDDFGVSRTYGFRRQHLGHDMMGQVGTPVIAVESGYVEAMGWNQYGGWRIGIRSFDGKRYYYYAHLRKNFPYVKSLQEGSIVQAGDVIGYLGRTGYSRTENTNNIDTPHLHFGMQIIFDESQKECNSEIWINCYEIVKFLYKNRSETVKNEETKEWYRTTKISDPAVEEYKKQKGIQ